MALRNAFMASRLMKRQFPRRIALIHTSASLAQSSSFNYANDNAANVSHQPVGFDDIETLLNSEPTWSVESLLPPEKKKSSNNNNTAAPYVPQITTQQLHHLLRLSALPLPKSQDEEENLLSTLSGQLHFVGKIQQVDTSGVKPLRAIRDETAAAEREQTITLETLKDALAKETVIGKHYKRIQRDTTPIDASDVENWDVLGSAERKQGKYFLVESERPQE